MKTFSCILTFFLIFAFLSSGIFLTKKHDSFKQRLEKEAAIEKKKLEEFNKRATKISLNIKKVNPLISDELANRISKVFVKKADEYNIKTEKLFLIAAVESKFDHKAINYESGDYGLMQVNWFWWGKRFCKKPSELLDIEKNIEIACKILLTNRGMGFKGIKYYHSLDDERAAIYENRIKKYASLI